MKERQTILQPGTALPQYGINRDQLDSWLIRLGGTVHHLRRTGEVAYSHPAIPQRPRANGRRKDAPAQLVRFVRQVLLRHIRSAADSRHGAHSIRGG